jgi:hypothetical protein
MLNIITIETTLPETDKRWNSDRQAKTHHAAMMPPIALVADTEVDKPVAISHNEPGPTGMSSGDNDDTESSHLAMASAPHLFMLEGLVPPSHADRSCPSTRKRRWHPPISSVGNVF